MSLYLSEDDMRNARLGLALDDLPAGELGRYLARASAWVDHTTHRQFTPADALSERLLTNVPAAAVIAQTGNVRLYPRLRSPIRSVTSVAYRVISVGQVGSAVAVEASDLILEPDHEGDGESVLVLGDFSAYRHPRYCLAFDLVYDGGYGTPTAPDYPAWLTEATLEYAAYLLKKRGASALVMGGTGIVVDQSDLGGHKGAAEAALTDHIRRF